MSQLRSTRIQRVADVAERRAERAAQAVACAVRSLDDARQQLGTLLRFHSEYAPATAGNDGPRIGAMELQNRSQFIERVRTAIEQGERDVQVCTARLEEARACWSACRSRSAALSVVAGRYRTAEQAVAERAEQAALDDRFQYAWNRGLTLPHVIGG